MILGVLFVMILSANWCFQWINHNVPNWIAQQNFWLVDFIYRAIRVIAPMFLLFSLVIVDLHIPSLVIGIVMYLLAFWIKRLIWYLAYNI